MVEKDNLGGLLGHYLFLGKRTLEKLQIKDQILGTGYVRSKNLFFREVNRGVDWIFSNHAVEVEKMRKELIQKQESWLKWRPFLFNNLSQMYKATHVDVQLWPEGIP